MRPDPRPQTAFLSLVRAAAALSLGVSLALIGGCASEPEVVEVGQSQLEPNTFEVAWKVGIDTAEYGGVESLFLRGESLIVYTDRNVVERISAGGGQPIFINRGVARPRDPLRPPLLVDAVGKLGQVEQYLVFPKNNSYALLTLDGDPIVVDGGTSNEAQLTRALTSGAVTSDGVLYAGVADTNGGRLIKTDPTKPAGNTLERVLFPGVIRGRPAVFQNLIYAADLNGYVYGVTEDMRAAWKVQAFKTEVGRGVQANLAVDEYGVYAAGTDGTLYALDRNTGRIRWRFLAGESLFSSPVPLGSYVYQSIPGQGVAAINKTDGSTNSRQPAWVAENAKGVLSHDDRHVYLLLNDNGIGAFDKESGEMLFKTQRNDFVRFARNTEGARIFAATADGQVVAIDPVLTRGVVGEMAMAPAVIPASHPVTDAIIGG